MLGQPSAAQLLEAVGLYLEKTALPQLSGHAAFHGKVAQNVLAIVQRELALGQDAAAREAARLCALLTCEPATIETLRQDLCARIEAGEMTGATPGLLDHLLATAADRVAIEQPTYASLQKASGLH
jgi:hypothetical protein